MRDTTGSYCYLFGEALHSPIQLLTGCLIEVKIGFTTNPVSRYNNMKVTLPEWDYLHAWFFVEKFALEVEKNLHKYYDSARKYREIFSLPPVEIQWLRRISSSHFENYPDFLKGDWKDKWKTIPLNDTDPFRHVCYATGVTP